MEASPTWLLFASLTVVGGLIYNIGMKFGPAQGSLYAFVLVLSFVLFLLQSASLLIAKFGFGVDVLAGFGQRNVAYAILAAFGVALIDVFYLLALRHGSSVQCQAFWTIGSMVALSIVSVLFFKETMPPMKILGIILGIAGLFLIIRS